MLKKFRKLFFGLGLFVVIGVVLFSGNHETPPDEVSYKISIFDHMTNLLYVLKTTDDVSQADIQLVALNRMNELIDQEMLNSEHFGHELTAYKMFVIGEIVKRKNLLDR